MSDKSYLSVYAKSFSWAGFFLPKKTFEKCSALYDFCRVADNIADDDDKIENKEKKFIQFENDFNQKNFDNPIVKNMWNIIEEFNISLKIVQDLLIGIKSDIKDQVKINSKKDLNNLKIILIKKNLMILLSKICGILLRSSIFH